MGKKGKKVLISGYIGFSNFGDDAMFGILVKHLKQFGCRITALSATPESTAKVYDIKSSYYKSLVTIFKDITNTDVLISGGGNLIQNETSFLNPFYYLFIIWLASIMGKRIILFSQGIGPLKGFFTKFIAKRILKKADLIIVRDEFSQRLLSKWKISNKLSHDAAWCINVPEKNTENIVGIQLRDSKLLNNEFFSFLAKYVDMFFSDNEIRIYSLQNQADLGTCYKFEKALKTRNPLLNAKVVMYKNPRETAIEFSQLKYLISMRLHACILGLKCGVKVLPIAYSDKVRNLANDLKIQYIEISKIKKLHEIFTVFTSDTKVNQRVLHAAKRQFDWSFLDMYIQQR